MTKQKQTYLDYNATAPVRPEVALLVYEILAKPGNASSVHGYGRAARAYLEKAREQVAAMAGTNPAYVTFNSGATEGNNTVLHGFAGKEIWISAIEHPAVHQTVPHAQKIPVTEDGIIDLPRLESMIAQDKKPDLVCLILVNNETGVIQPVAKAVRIIRKASPKTLIHCDAAQAPGKVGLDFSALQTDYMCLSAHKMGGPQGTGALISAPGAPPVKLFHGGGQEKRQRAGTENIAGIAGFGLAAELAVQSLDQFQKLEKLRNDMEASLLDKVPGLKIYGQNAPRIANTSCLCYPAIPAQTQMMSLDLDGIAVSSGSACSSGTIKPSKTLMAMGADEKEASSSLRISMGWDSTSEDVDRFMEAWLKMVSRINSKESQNA